MKPRRTPSSHVVFQLPGGNEDNDLWAAEVAEQDGGPAVLSVWEPTADERARIAAGENIELIIWGAVMPPVAMRVTDEPLGAG